MKSKSPKRLVFEQAKIKSLLGRPAAIVIQTECEDEDSNEQQFDFRFVQASGFNNNVYNNCDPDYTCTSAMNNELRLLPSNEAE